MEDPHRVYEIRCPVHGFIALTSWERDIISQPAFQRLRRIRQLAWTDQVYPGAMHTRFEHSLGVMHVATRLYDAIVERSQRVLEEDLSYNKAGLERDRALVRLTALLHDIGHGPFSHAAEELMPPLGEGPEKYQHEHYSSAVIRYRLRDVIEEHPMNRNYGFTVEDVTALIEGSAKAGHRLFWRELISGQLDADRIDYLLRDSLHAGVDYGRFDWRRLLHTVVAVRLDDREEGGVRLGVSEGGFHAAEALVLARYFMFTQVYFHKTRVAFDHHLREALAAMLPGGRFPSPQGAELDEYLTWDDWRVLGLLAGGEGGEHGQRLASRDHYRAIFDTPETPTAADFLELEQVRGVLGDFIRHEALAEKSWYKVGPADIPVVSGAEGRRVRPLSQYSTVIAQMRPIRKVLVYARREDAEAARERLRTAGKSPRPEANEYAI